MTPFTIKILFFADKKEEIRKEKERAEIKSVACAYIERFLLKIIFHESVKLILKIASTKAKNCFFFIKNSGILEYFKNIPILNILIDHKKKNLSIYKIEFV